jgi:hypothetical protein
MHPSHLKQLSKLFHPIFQKESIGQPERNSKLAAFLSESALEGTIEAEAASKSPKPH